MLSLICLLLILLLRLLVLYRFNLRFSDCLHLNNLMLLFGHAFLHRALIHLDHFWLLNKVCLHHSGSLTYSLASTLDIEIIH